MYNLFTCFKESICEACDESNIESCKILFPFQNFSHYRNLTCTFFFKREKIFGIVSN